MRPARTLILLAAVLGGALFLSCSKKSSAPTAPQEAPPACAVNPSTLDFGTVAVGSSADRQLTLTNNGGAR
jgi:hypothetical protein